MLTIYDTDGSKLQKKQGTNAVTDQTVWIDLLNPTPDEDALVEQALSISIPTRAEMREIEVSNRLYQESGAYFMTALIVHNIETPAPTSSAVTFILAGHRLVTVRYAELKAFAIYGTQVEKGDTSCNRGASVLAGLIEALVHRKADFIERIQDEVDRLAHGIFDIKGGKSTRNRRLDVTLRGIGHQGDLTSRAQESSASVERLLYFFAQAARDREDEKRLQQRIELLQRDIRSLMDHMRFLSERVGFLLDATLGMITTEQNQIIKLFSVVAVMLMPPTLVASIYGMNFRQMPELNWPWGYPLALGLMLISAVLPYIYFRRKGWL